MQKHMFCHIAVGLRTKAMAGLSRLVRPSLAVVFFMGGYLANKMHFATKMVQGVEREKIPGLLSFETSLKEFYVKEAQEVRC